MEKMKMYDAHKDKFTNLYPYSYSYSHSASYSKFNSISRNILIIPFMYSTDILCMLKNAGDGM